MPPSIPRSALYHECADDTMPSSSARTPVDSPILRTFSQNRPKWVHFCRSLAHSAKKSPFPGIKKAGRERTLSGKMTPILRFLSSKGRLLSLPPHILTLHSSKNSKTTTQASYQNLGGYMCLHRYFDTRYDCRFHRLGVCKGCAAAPPVNTPHVKSTKTITLIIPAVGKSPGALSFQARSID